MQAKFAALASLLMLAGNTIAKPVNGVEKRQLGGLGQILSDHVKYVSNPPSALQPIPASQNNPAREAHRDVHAALFQATGGAANGGGAVNANPLGGLLGGLLGGNAAGGNAAGGSAAGGSAADGSAAASNSTSGN